MKFPPGRRGGGILGLEGGPRGSMQNQAPRIWAQESSPLERRGGGTDLAQWGSYEKGSKKAKLFPRKGGGNKHDLKGLKGKE